MADGILTPCNVARSWHWFRQATAPCNVACGSGIVTANTPSGSTLQCDTWLWDDMPLNLPKRPPYWNSTYGFDFDHITTVDMSFCTRLPVSEILSKSDHPRQKKMTSCQFSRWRISAILDFTDPTMSSLKAQLQLPIVNRHYSSKLLSFWENRVFLRFGDRQTNKQTDEQLDSINALSPSCCRERRLNNFVITTATTTVFSLSVLLYSNN